MPSRRPYASRGVPRRATTQRAGRSVPAAGVLALAVVGLVLAVIVWVASPFDALTAHKETTTAGFRAVADRAAVAAGGQAAGAGAAAPGAAASDATPLLLTTRHWDPVAPGIVVDPVLSSRLDQALLGVEGHVGLAVKDLGSGRGAVLGGNLELAAASLYKLPVLYSVFDGGLRMAEDLPISDEALSYDAGTMELGAGETLTVAEALERMVTLSDNTSAVMLGSRVGALRVNANIAALGMETTHYSLERMTTSALDMLLLMDLLAQGKAVSPAASADMLHLLLRQRVNDRLPRLLPANVQIAHKTGNLPGTVNDVGILYGPSSTIAVAVLVSDTSDEAAAATGIARAALAAYTYFDEQPAASARPLLPPAPDRPIPPVWREPRPVPTRTPTPEPTSVIVVVEATPTLAVPTLPPTAAPTPATPAATPGATPRPATPTPPRPPTATPVPGPPTATPVSPPPTRAPTPRPTPPPAPTALPGRR